MASPFSEAEVSGQVRQTASEEKPSAVTETPETLSDGLKSSPAASQCDESFDFLTVREPAVKSSNVIECVG